MNAGTQGQPQFTVIQVRSGAGRSQKQKSTLKSLGLGKIGMKVTVLDQKSTRGMINVVSHLIKLVAI